MPKAIVTGSGGLIGSESAGGLVEAGYDVVGIENDTRAVLFGPDASTSHVTERLSRELRQFRRSTSISATRTASTGSSPRAGVEIELIVHTAAQPSHDWAASDPQTDFGINANGTLNLLEATRKHCPEATFIFTSTNKVYGDTPNRLPLVELDTRLEMPADHRYFTGIDTTMSIDRDPALALRRIQGRGRPAGPGIRALLRHAYRLLPRRLPDRAQSRRRATARLPGLPDEVHGHRRPLHSVRLQGQAGARQHPQRRPGRRLPALPQEPTRGAVYNIGGGRESKLLDARGDRDCEEIAGRELRWKLSDRARVGDHRWWISDLDEFGADYGGWRPQRDLETILREIYEANAERWAAASHEALRRHPRAQRRGLRSAKQSTDIVSALRREIDHEVIVVDDSSADGTAEVVERSPGAPPGSLPAIALSATVSASRYAPASRLSRATR